MEQDPYEIQARLEQARATAPINLPVSPDDLEKYQNPPRWPKFALLYFVAGLADLIDLAGLTGFGWFLSVAFDIFADTIIFLFARGARNKAKHLSYLQEKLPMMVETVSKRYLSGLKSARKMTKNIPALRSVVNRAGLLVAKARNSPIGKQILAMTLDLIPILEVLPFRTLGIYLLWRDEKNTYKDMQPVVEYYNELFEELAA